MYTRLPQAKRTTASAESSSTGFQPRPFKDRVDPVQQSSPEDAQAQPSLKNTAQLNHNFGQLAIHSVIQSRRSHDEPNAPQVGEVVQSKQDGNDGAASTDLETNLAQSQGNGTPLPDNVRSFMEPRFGVDFSAVRVHTDSRAVQMNRELGAQAFTHRDQIYFGSGKYSPDSNQGKQLLAHELTHVVQQTGLPQRASESQSPSVQQATEQPRLSRAPAQIQCFKQGNDDRPGGHAWMTSQTLHNSMGLSQDEAHQGRLGNWERDLSQAITPGTVAILQEEGVFGILNVLSIKEFGRGLDPAEFGTYDPVEHMDNPTDLRASDVYQQGDFSADRNVTPANPDAAGSGLQTAGDESQAYADVDSRYAATQTSGKVMNPDDAHAYQVDESGIPVYMNTSKEWLKRSMRGAAGQGRRRNGGRGPRDFASGIHVMQDYYAHSNFAEIAINLLIRSGTLQVENAAGQLVGVQTDTLLDTHLHANDSSGNPQPGNLMFAGREVMTTGSFNLTDTAASLLEELKDHVIDLNPFKEKDSGPSPLVNACLDYLDMEGPTDFSATGREIAELIHPVSRTIARMGDMGASVVEVAGEVAGDVASESGSFGADVLRGLSRVNGWLGGDSDYFESEAQAVEGVGNRASGAITGTTGEAAEGIRRVTGALDAFATSLEDRQHLLRDLYAWLSGLDPLAPIKAMARSIPVVGEAIADLIASLQRQLREKAEELLGRAWNQVVIKVVAALNRAIARVREHTNISTKKTQGREAFDLFDPTTWDDAIDRKFGAVGDLYDENGRPRNGIAPSSYTPPSHTQIAKDHGDMTSPVRDQIPDQENHEHADGDAHSEGNEPPGHEHAPGEDEHGHIHISAWLNPIAEALATQATDAIGRKVADVWNKVDPEPPQPVTSGDLDAIDREVDQWFQHPADCMPVWHDMVRGMVSSSRFGPELLRQLAERRAATPASQPSTSGGPTTAEQINRSHQDHPE